MILKVTGVHQVGKALRQLAMSVPIDAARALNVVAEETMTNAKERTPVGTGTLKRSGKVHEYATARRLSAGLSFGTEYAVYVHERMNVSHPNGEAKFLENAVKFTALYFEQRIANEINLSKAGGSGIGAGSPGGAGSL